MGLLICYSVKNDTYVQNDVLSYRHGRDNLGLPHLHTTDTHASFKKNHVHICLKYFINILFFSHNKSIQHCLFLKPNNRSLCKVPECRDIAPLWPRNCRWTPPPTTSTTTMHHQLKSWTCPDVLIRSLNIVYMYMFNCCWCRCTWICVPHLFNHTSLQLRFLSRKYRVKDSDLS